MGVNGYIWVSVSVGERNNAAVEGFVDAEGVYSDINDVSQMWLMYAGSVRADRRFALTPAVGHFAKFSPGHLPSGQSHHAFRTVFDPSERHSFIRRIRLVPRQRSDQVGSDDGQGDGEAVSDRDHRDGRERGAVARSPCIFGMKLVYDLIIRDGQIRRRHRLCRDRNGVRHGTKIALSPELCSSDFKAKAAPTSLVAVPSRWTACARPGLT